MNELQELKKYNTEMHWCNTELKKQIKQLEKDCKYLKWFSVGLGITTCLIIAIQIGMK